MSCMFPAPPSTPLTTLSISSCLSSTSDSISGVIASHPSGIRFAGTPTGPIPPTIQYLVPGPNGSVLTMSFDGNLDSINPNTGAISVIGPTGFADCSSPSSPTCGPNSQLSFGSAGGTLYATDFANNLYTLN